MENELVMVHEHLLKVGHNRDQKCISWWTIIGDDAGTLNFARIKGSHTAMKSGMIAAETILESLLNNKDSKVLDHYAKNF